MSVHRNIKDILTRAFGQGSMSRDGINYAVCCPACDSNKRNKRKLEVRLDDARYHCWVCGIKGSDVRYLIRKYRPDLADKVSTLKTSKTLEDPTSEEIKISLPKRASLLGCSNSKDPDIIATKKYLLRRGVSLVDMMRWRILASPTGDFRRKAIIPSFDSSGNLNYYVARSIDDLGGFRYKNAKVPKENVIFNEIDIDWKRPLILVEGVFDAIKCPENTIPILGSSISTRSLIYREIAKNQTKCIVALDPDLKTKAYKLAKMIKKIGCEVDIAFAPEGKDMGDLSKLQARQVIDSAAPYTDIMHLSYKINEIQSGSII